MKKIATWAGAMLPLIFYSAQSAHANSVNIQTFTPAAGTSYVFSEDALMQVAPGDNSWTGERMYFHLLYNFLHDPLVEFDPTHTTRSNVLVNNINTFDLGIGILPLKNLMLSVNLPMNWENGPGTSAQFGWGDLKIEGKWRVTEDDAPVAIALIPNIYVPTGDQTLFLSNGSTGLGMSISAEHDFGGFRVAGNIGYRHTSNAIYQDVNYTNMIPMSLSAYIPIDNQWGINVEGFGSLSMPVNHYNNPGEFYAGARYQIREDASAILGASTGTLGGGGSGDFRVIAGLKFAPMELLVSKPDSKPIPVGVPVAPPPPAQPAAKPTPRPVIRQPVAKPSPMPSPKSSPAATPKKARKHATPPVPKNPGPQVYSPPPAADAGNSAP